MGMSSWTRLAARIPATRAVPKTSPFGRSPRTTASRVAVAMRTKAEALAIRRVTLFAPTSTMLAEPFGSTWVRTFMPLSLSKGTSEKKRPTP